MTPLSLGPWQACMLLLEIPAPQWPLCAKGFASSPMTQTCRRPFPENDCCTLRVSNHLDNHFLDRWSAPAAAGSRYVEAGQVRSPARNVVGNSSCLVAQGRTIGT